jgi:hypothetical protein
MPACQSPDRRAVLVVLLAAAAAWPLSAQGADARVVAFLDRPAGPWVGRAETTPSGPRPYDMTFVRRADGGLEAAASPGASTHHWTFLAAAGGLELTFLSTFAGNREPQRFAPATFAGEEARFTTTKRPDRLEVRVRPGRERLEIDVLRHGRLHVGIRLQRGAGTRREG